MLLSIQDSYISIFIIIFVKIHFIEFIVTVRLLLILGNLGDLLCMYTHDVMVVHHMKTVMIKILKVQSFILH